MVQVSDGDAERHGAAELGYVPEMRIPVAGLAFILGCGGVSMGGGGGADGPSAVVDAPQPGSGVGSGVVKTITCGPHVFTQGSMASSFTTTTTYFAIVADVAPGDDFAVEQCDQRLTIQNGSGSVFASGFGVFVDPPCNGCDGSGSGDPFPTGNVCTWSHAGTFVGDKLVVQCGTTTVSGGPTSGTGIITQTTMFTTTRVHH